MRTRQPPCYTTNRGGSSAGSPTARAGARWKRSGQSFRTALPRTAGGLRGRFWTTLVPMNAPRMDTNGSEGLGSPCFRRFRQSYAAPRANAHFEELKRKFDASRKASRAQWHCKLGWSSRRSRRTATNKMTDDQWLRAIGKYRLENQWQFSQDEVTGGAEQLAQVFGERVKEEPERFARLSLRFSADANSVYLERTLLALKEAPIASDLKLQVCCKAFAESRGPCGRFIADVLGNIEDPLPDDAVRMLHQLATEHEDPASEAWQEDSWQRSRRTVRWRYPRQRDQYHARKSGRRHWGPHPLRRRLHRAVPPDPRPDDQGPERGRALMRRRDPPGRLLSRSGTWHVALPEHEPVRRSSARDAPRLRFHPWSFA